MTRRISNATLCYAFAALVLLAAGACSASTTFDRTVQADPRGSVEISNVSGNVVITGWDRDEVAVHGRLDSGVERVDVTTMKGRTVIKVVLPRMSFMNNGDADLEVHVPKESEVQATTVSADLTTSQLLGPQSLKTVSGQLRADVGKDFEAKTVSGDMRLRSAGQRGEARLSTVSGDITLDKAAGDVEATSVSGDVRLNVEDAGGIRMHSTSGDLTFRGMLTDTGTVEAETVSGDVSLHVRGHAGYEYEIASFSGDIGNCFGREAQSTSRHGPGTRLMGTQGEGRGRLRVKSMSGDIDLCDR